MGARTAGEDDGSDAEQRDEQISDVHSRDRWGLGGGGERASARPATGSEVIDIPTIEQPG